MNMNMTTTPTTKLNGKMVTSTTISLQSISIETETFDSFANCKTNWFNYQINHDRLNGNLSTLSHFWYERARVPTVKTTTTTTPIDVHKTHIIPSTHTLCWLDSVFVTPLNRNYCVTKVCVSYACNTELMCRLIWRLHNHNNNELASKPISPESLQLNSLTHKRPFVSSVFRPLNHTYYTHLFKHINEMLFCLEVVQWPWNFLFQFYFAHLYTYFLRLLLLLFSFFMSFNRSVFLLLFLFGRAHKFMHLCTFQCV